MESRFKEIDEIAELLKELNDERKAMTENGTKLAIGMIESNYKNDKVLVIFVEELKDNNIEWVGSSNQRVIDVKKTFDSGEVTLVSYH